MGRERIKIIPEEVHKRASVSTVWRETSIVVYNITDAFSPGPTRSLGSGFAPHPIQMFNSHVKYRGHLMA